MIYLWSSELYPSEIRGTALGMCSLSGRLGGIAAPQVRGCENRARHSFTQPTLRTQIALFIGPALNSEAAPFLILGGCSIFGGLLSLMLPETLGSPLMLSLDELEGLSGRTKPMLKWWNNEQLRETLERNTRARAEGMEKKDKA